MLLFEFAGELFQFEQPDPELPPLFQLPASNAASLPGLPLALFGQPRTYHSPHLRKHD